MKKLTMERLDTLKAIASISQKSQHGLAKRKEIVKMLGKNTIPVSKLLTKLFRDGLIENPIVGCWRLTLAGNELISRFAAGSELSKDIVESTPSLSEQALPKVE